MHAYVRSECHQGITTIEFFDPRENVLTATLLEQLIAAIRNAGSDPHSKVILLRAAGAGMFSAGLSLEEITLSPDPHAAETLFNLLARLIIVMHKCPQFIIVRIQGRCLGEALGLVTGADYAIATEAADIRLEGLTAGKVPYVTAPVIERKIGAAAYSELAVDTEKGRNAEWARKTGLYAEVYAAPDTMEEAVYRLLHFLAQLDAGAMASMKNVLWEETSHWEQLLLEKAALSAREFITHHPH